MKVKTETPQTILDEYRVESEFYIQRFGGKKGNVREITYTSTETPIYHIQFDNGEYGFFYEEELEKS